MKSMILGLIVNSLSFLVVSKVLPGFKIKTPGTAVLCAVVMAILSWVALTFLWLPIILLMGLSAALTGPFAIVLWVLGYFLLYTGLIMATDYLIEDFSIDSMSTALVGAFLMGLSASLISRLFH